MSYDDYAYDSDYDAMEHMMNDPVGFQTYGYGGFGFDTSNVPPDDPTPPLVCACLDGDINLVKSMLESCSDKDKPELTNKARRWTEVDYKASGFTKEFEWYGLTPLIAAANKGLDEIVEFLLRNGADPTLDGNSDDDFYGDALITANRAGKRLLDSANLKRCIELLEEAGKFWKRARYAHGRYTNDGRKRAGYDNKPTDLEGLIEALEKIPPAPVVQDCSASLTQAAIAASLKRRRETTVQDASISKKRSTVQKVGPSTITSSSKTPANMKTPEKQISCENCKKKFNTEANLENHKRDANRIRVNARQKKKNIGKSISCNVLCCPKLFSKQADLNSHKRSTGH